MKYVIYRTINKINGKIYIGAHKTSNLNDDYVTDESLVTLEMQVRF